MLWTHLDAARAGNVGGDGLAQLGKALCGPVVRPAFIEGLLGRFHNVWRRGEIGLADLQVDHAAPLRFQSARLHQYVKSRLDPEPADSFSQFHNLRKKGTPSRSSTSATRSL